MTTIAFKDGVLAADRLMTEGCERYGYATKIGSSHDSEGRPVLFAACGCTAFAQRFREWCVNGLGAGNQAPEMRDGDETKGHGFIFYEDGTMVSFDPGQPPFTTELLRVGIYAVGAYGNGGGAALGAMAMGANATEAVLVACRFDTSSGGGIDVVSFRDPVVRRATLLTPI